MPNQARVELCQVLDFHEAHHIDFPDNCIIIMTNVRNVNGIIMGDAITFSDDDRIRIYEFGHVLQNGDGFTHHSKSFHIEEFAYDCLNSDIDWLYAIASIPLVAMLAWLTNKGLCDPLEDCKKWAEFLANQPKEIESDE